MRISVSSRNDHERRHYFVNNLESSIQLGVFVTFNFDSILGNSKIILKYFVIGAQRTCDKEISKCLGFFLKYIIVFARSSHKFDAFYTQSLCP